MGGGEGVGSYLGGYIFSSAFSQLLQLHVCTLISLI